LVQAVLAAFPGTTIEEVRDAAADAYGLLPDAATGAAQPPAEAGEVPQDDAAPAEDDDPIPPEDR
jgi:DNA polymerase-3 subunit gamma/tau